MNVTPHGEAPDSRRLVRQGGRKFERNPGVGGNADLSASPASLWTAVKGWMDGWMGGWMIDGGECGEGETGCQSSIKEGFYAWSL